MKKTIIFLFILCVLNSGIALADGGFAVAGNYILRTSGSYDSQQQQKIDSRSVYDEKFDTYYYPYNYATQEDLARPGTHIVGDKVIKTTGSKYIK